MTLSCGTGASTTLPVWHGKESGGGAGWAEAVPAAMRPHASAPAKMRLVVIVRSRDGELRTHNNYNK